MYDSPVYAYRGSNRLSLQDKLRLKHCLTGNVYYVLNIPNYQDI